jgi:hypothetical protein
MELKVLNRARVELLRHKAVCGDKTDIGEEELIELCDFWMENSELLNELKEELRDALLRIDDLERAVYGNDEDSKEEE